MVRIYVRPMAYMKIYELDKSTGELIWIEDTPKVLELEKMLNDSHTEKYVEQPNGVKNK